MNPSALPVLLALVRATPAAAGFEWAGAFPLDDPSHTWSMQAVDGSYADPSMRLVLFATDAPGEEAIESNEAAAEAMIEGDACAKVEAGQTIALPSGDGSCYELHVSADPDSLFPMDTAGLAGFAVFAQHFPTEFERDQHYLKDSAGTDIEPVATEGGDGHDHAHGHGGEAKKSGTHCACEADRLDFNIDCTAKARMLDSLEALKSKSCATDCSSDDCVMHYFIVQAHHDHCGVNDIPSEIEDGFHDYDSQCAACDIARVYTPGAPSCPAPNCSDNSGNEAYDALVNGGCAQDCSSDACKNNFFLLRSTHDLCDHDVLATASEEGLHDFEDYCIEQVCNAEEASADELKCKDGHEDHGDEKVDESTEDASDGVAVAASAVVAIAGVVMMMA